MYKHCEVCWDNPCNCGWEYRPWEIDRIKHLISVLEKLVEEKQEEGKSHGNTRTGG
jgi:hypothetical protein